MNKEQKDSTFPIYNAPRDNEGWRGLGGHFSGPDQILAEFIDNALSAFRAHPGDQNAIRIVFEEVDADTVKVTVEDSGSGILDLDNALTLAGKDAQETILNEHGFGMKHALAAADPDNAGWTICTRTAADANRKRSRKVTAPYRMGNSFGEYVPAWPGVFGDTGTIISFCCARSLLDSIMDGPTELRRSLLDVAARMAEELGYIYAPALAGDELSITVVGVEKGGNKKSFVVHPVMPHWNEETLCAPKSAMVDLGGGPVKVTLRYGEIIPADDGHHYAGNQETSGVEIRVDGRLMEGSLYKEIFGNAKHPSQNLFLCQIDLSSDDRKALPATNPTKTHFKEDDPKLAKLYAWVRSNVPKVSQSDGRSKERALFELLQKQKETHILSATPHQVETERYAFAALGEKLRIDLFASSNDEITIYEGKRKVTTPKDVYQLIMYWDGCVWDGTPPTTGILLGGRHPKSVLAIVEMMNKRLDPTGRPYNLVVKTWADEGIDPEA